jgi:NAD(P)-dependent dehydrogenase (short-subunit alcohol dehydrogenase family)
MAAPQMFNLDGRVAVVTGGNGGIGRGIALGLAEAGAAVAVLARNQDKNEAVLGELRALNSASIALKLDVTDRDALAPAMSEVERKLGPVDILVNNAGIAGPTKRSTDMSLAEWQEVLDINLTGAWLASRAAIPAMVKQKTGNILMISSGAGRRGYPFRSPYAASKWAMIGLTQTLAGEWGVEGIRVNCICPGAVEGDRIERVIQARAEATKTPYEQVKRNFTATAAMQRMVTEEEVARVSLFLASDLSAGVTGQTINVDAGNIMN